MQRFFINLALLIVIFAALLFFSPLFEEWDETPEGSVSETTDTATEPVSSAADAEVPEGVVATEDSSASEANTPAEETSDATSGDTPVDSDVAGGEEAIAETETTETLPAEASVADEEPEASVAPGVDAGEELGGDTGESETPGSD